MLSLRLLATTAAAVVLTLLLLQLLHVSEALRCYDCHSFMSPQCMDPFVEHAAEMTVCDQAQDCYKAKTLNKTSGLVSITRTCVDTQIVGCTSDQSDDTTDDVQVTFCTCDTDLCNSAPHSLQAPPIFALIGALIGLMINGGKNACS